MNTVLTPSFAIRQDFDVAPHPADVKQRPRKALTIAVIVPCYNESASIAKVVTDFRSALPSARIYVYDNNSMDETVARARAAGAILRKEALQGKGNVVRRMFADVDADV